MRDYRLTLVTGRILEYSWNETILEDTDREKLITYNY